MQINLLLCYMSYAHAFYRLNVDHVLRHTQYFPPMNWKLNLSLGPVVGKMICLLGSPGRCTLSFSYWRKNHWFFPVSTGFSSKLGFGRDLGGTLRRIVKLTRSSCWVEFYRASISGQRPRLDRWPVIQKTTTFTICSPLPYQISNFIYSYVSLQSFETGHSEPEINSLSMSTATQVLEIYFKFQNQPAGPMS